jgi:hypothetical protein
MTNGRPSERIDDIKCPQLNPYTAQSNCDSERAAAVRSELYKLRTVDVAKSDVNRMSLKDTGQLDRYCIPASGMLGMPPPKRGMILVASASAGKRSWS